MRHSLLSAVALIIAMPAALAAECDATDDAGRIHRLAQASYPVHVRDQQEYAPGKILGGIEYKGQNFDNAGDFATFLAGIPASGKAEVKHLADGRTAYWDAATGTLLVINPKVRSCGRATRPKHGYPVFKALH